MMNITMPPPISYPFYMDTSRQTFPNNPWSTNPYQYSVPMHPQYPNNYQSTPSYPSPFILRHAQHPSAPVAVAAPPPPPPTQPSQPRFLSSVTSCSNMRYNHLKQSTSYINRHRSMEVSFHQQSTPSTTHYYQHGRPMKTKSVTDFHQIAQAHSTHLAKAHSWHSIHHPSNGFHHHHHHHRSHYTSTPTPPVIKPILPRFSTFQEMPIIQNPIYQRSHSTSSYPSKKTHRRKSKSPCHSSCSSTTSSSNSRSSSSSNSRTSLNGHRSFQQRCNGTLRTDPLLVAAMEDFQQLHRASNLSTPLTTPRANLSRDSLCSDSTDHSSTRSRTHSHSSFTSLERLEIRHLIKALKTKGISSLDLPIVSNPPPTSIVPIKTSISQPKRVSPLNKHQKSTITEELDQKFAQLRSTHPNEELIYVKPSLLNKQGNPISTCLSTTNKTSIIEIPLPPPLPSSIDESIVPTTTTKPEYAVPMKNSSNVNIRPHAKKTEQCRSFSFCKPMNDLVEETRPVSMFNWFHYGLSNPIPTNFQNKEKSKNIGKSLVKENIYASEIDVHVPCADPKDFLNDPNFMLDYLSTCKSSTKHSSVFADFSRLFTRFGHHRQEEKCKRKSKLQKNNYLSCTLM